MLSSKEHPVALTVTACVDITAEAMSDGSNRCQGLCRQTGLTAHHDDPLRSAMLMSSVTLGSAWNGEDFGI